jgi:galactokinase
MIVGRLKKLFIEKYNREPLLVRSPGRINLIGEHTDYNEGYVLPAAIDKAAYIAVSLRDDDEIHLTACDLNETFSINTRDLKPIGDINWPNYILGAAAQFKENGKLIKGFNAILSSDIPIGAGLSSSAAVECSVVFALNELLQTKLEKIEMVKMAQKAEHEYAGVKCGIMDQFASMFGKKEHVLRLDCRSLQYEYFPLRMEDLKIVLLDTGVKHSLALSEYNVRREQCDEGVAMIQKKYADVKNLRDADIKMINKCIDSSSLIYRRCKFIVEENIRLLHACEALAVNDIETLGKKMYATHEGLSKEYEVSCSELDFLVNAVKDDAGVIGARMMGGGFGGCTVNLVKKEAVNSLIQRVTPLYEKAMNLELKNYIVSPENGTSVVPA